MKLIYCTEIYQFISYIFLITAVIAFVLTPWLMKPGGSMPHSQGLSDKPYPEPNQLNYQH